MGCGWLPKAEDDERDSQPADAGQALVVPHAACDAGDVGNAADGGDAAAQHGGQIFIAGDVDTGSVRRCGGFADGPEIQALARLIQEPCKEDGKREGEIRQNVVLEQQRAEHGNVAQEGGEGGVHEDRLEIVAQGDVGALLHAHVFAEELGLRRCRRSSGQGR